MTKITKFPELKKVTGDEILPVVFDNSNYRIAVSALLELYGPNFKGILTDETSLPAVEDSKRGWIFQVNDHLFMLGEDAANPGTDKWQDMGDFRGKAGDQGKAGVDGVLPDFASDAAVAATQAEFKTALDAAATGAKPTEPAGKRYNVPKDASKPDGDKTSAGYTVYPTPKGRYVWAFGPNAMGDGVPATFTAYIPDGGDVNYLSWTHYERGEKGEAGKNGSDGKNAVGMSVVGLLDEGKEADLPDPTDYEVGNTYIVGKHFWMKIGVEWVDIGDFTGPDGASAYKIAVLNGFKGTEADWLKSLKGADGIGLRIIGSLENKELLPEKAEFSGDTYIIQEKMYVWDGSQWSTVGQVGPEGKAGESIYEIAVRLGFKGTETEFIESQRGPEGKQGIQGIQGEPGKDGKDGKDGDNASSVDFKGGKSTASELPSTGNSPSDAWLTEDDRHLHIWTGLAWYDTGVFAAKGEKGDDGDQGKEGPIGKTGNDGKDGVDGKSAFELAQADGYKGTLSQWLVSLIGNGLLAKGTVGDFSNLANIANPEKGWAYNVIGGDKIGHQYVYDGTQFVDMGDIRGQQGKQGIQGIQGAPGPSLIPKGHVADSSDLLAVANPVGGWLYNVTGGDDAGHQFVYNGTDWIDMGSIVGPEGKEGPEGKQGVAGKNAGGVNFKGVVTAQNLLPTDGNIVSDAYFVGQNLFVWSTDLKWVDCGSFQGLKGEKGDPGNDGKDGEIGKTGPDGKSAYEVAKANGETKTEAQWLASLVGAPIQGKGSVADLTALNAVANPQQGWLYNVLDTGHMYIYNKAWIDMGLVRGIQGIQGDPGIQGIAGADGKDGKDGKSILGKGRVAAKTDLPASPEFGWAYFVNTNLFIYDGTDWVDFGDFVGPEGEQGEKGDIGAGIKILGKKTQQSELPESGTIGDGYMIGTDFWVYDGTEYVNVGPIQGPRGLQGLRGIQGLKGEKGDPGDEGKQGEQGTIIIILNRDPSPVDGRINDYFMSTIDQKLYRKTSDTAWAYLGTFGGGNVMDCPADGKQYIRINGNWVVFPYPAIPENDGIRYFMKNGKWDPFLSYDVAVLASTGECDFAKGQWFILDGTKSLPLTLKNMPAAGRGCVVMMTFTGKGGTMTWPTGVKWSGGTVPTFGDTRTLLTFSWDGGVLMGSLSQSY